MTEGTRSYLIGCHQFLLHPIFVLLAWRLQYHAFPKWWEIIAILFHDIGICGRQYLSDDKAKKGHWYRGAILACRIASTVKREPLYWTPDHDWKEPLWKQAVELCAGHCPEESGYPESKLSRADKRSRLVAPIWWTRWEYWAEWHGKNPGITSHDAVIKWRKLVAENLRSENPVGNHELYLRNKKS